MSASCRSPPAMSSIRIRPSQLVVEAPRNCSQREGGDRWVGAWWWVGGGGDIVCMRVAWWQVRGGNMGEGVAAIERATGMASVAV